MAISSVLALLVVIPAIINFADAHGCLHPATMCQCFFEDYQCANGFSYGCNKGKCWAQCATILAGCGEWCYTKFQATGNPMYCKSNEECVKAANCGLAECNGGCTISESKWQRYRALFLLGNK